jgi:hypothetical protein
MFSLGHGLADRSDRDRGLVAMATIELIIVLIVLAGIAMIREW